MPDAPISSTDAPIEAGEFDRLLAACGPFEEAPAIAVATSGGADSMTLCLLAADWARRNGGRAIALTVDHGLRPESRREARQVGHWLKARGIEHAVLRWTGAKPDRGIQAAAREARYRLLARWCRRQHVLHLLLGHHLEDQAETFLLRLARGSGVEGLAAMARIIEDRTPRILRPVLDLPRNRLLATVSRAKQPWIEDPSNLDPAFRRVRMRLALGTLSAQGVTSERLAATARNLRRARAALEDATFGLMARAVAVHPVGFCLLRPEPIMAAEPEVALRLLARTIMCVGGAAYPPRFQRLSRLYESMPGPGGGAARTLGGCRVTAWRGRILVCREASAAAEVLPLRPGGRGLWDGRFQVRLSRIAGRRLRAPYVRRLGRAGWTEAASRRPALRKSPIPGSVRPSLPALWDIDGLVSVPHLRYDRSGAFPGESVAFETVFRPARSLASATVTVV